MEGKETFLDVGRFFLGSGTLGKGRSEEKKVFSRRERDLKKGGKVLGVT